MDFKGFINQFVELAQGTIIELEQGKLKGDEKKAELDKILTEWALSAINSLKVNVFLKAFLRWVVNNYLSVITQKIFDLIQVRVSGITKTKAA